MEVIIGVLIGGVIGYVAAITTLVVEHRRWRKEFKLQYLITERIRREEQCDRINKLLEEGLNTGVFTFEFMTTILKRLPLKLRNLIFEAMKEKQSDDSDEGTKKLRQKVSLVLGNYLGVIDKQIEELTQ